MPRPKPIIRQKPREPRNEFLNVSNQTKEKMMGYIINSIDPEFDLLKIGMKDADEDIIWFNIQRLLPMLMKTQSFLWRYAAEKGVSSIKSFAFKYSGRTLFSSDLKKSPKILGMQEGDIISVYLRPSAALSVEKVPLKPLHDQSKFQSPTGKTKCKRKKSSLTSYIDQP